MSDTSAGHPSAGRYEIRVKGHLGSRWAAWFDGMTLTARATAPPSSTAPSPTRPRCTACCSKLRDLGLPLISVTQVDTATPTCPIAEPRPTRTGD